MTGRPSPSRPARRPRTLAALALGLGALLASPAPRSFGEEDEEAPLAGPPPTMDDALAQTDPKGVMSVKLPREWKTVKRDAPPRGELIVFGGRYTERDAGQVVLSVDATAARAPLALWNQLKSGKIQEDRARSGPGWVEGCSISSDDKRPIAEFVRCIEKDGQVYVASVLAHRNSYGNVKEMAAKILDSVEVKKPVPREGLPKGWTVKKVGEFDLWTDSDDPGKAARPAPIVGEARSVLVKALKGKPFDESRPVIKSYQNAGRFTDETKEYYGEGHSHASWDPYARAVMVVTMTMGVNDYAPAVHNNAARHYLVQYFGGEPPLWVLLGLQRYGLVGAQAGGKPQDPPKEWVARGKSAAANGTRNFDSWLMSGGGSDVPDVEQAANELWAWHFFFRHGGGKKYRKAYDASLDALRATGDPLAARKAWEGTDFEAMTKDFRDWAAKWEP